MSDETQPPVPSYLQDPKAAAARIAELEAERDQLRTKLDNAAVLAPLPPGEGETVRVKVEPPHSHMVYGGRVISTEWTELPAALSSAFHQAAADAGVTLTQDQEG